MSFALRACARSLGFLMGYNYAMPGTGGSLPGVTELLMGFVWSMRKYAFIELVIVLCTSSVKSNPQSYMFY